MFEFQDLAKKHRYEQAFADDTGASHRVWGDYADSERGRAILHVEADTALQGTGAAGRFMQSLADHARAEGTKLVPRCGYAVAWFKRHPDQADILT